MEIRIRNQDISWLIFVGTTVALLSSCGTQINTLRKAAGTSSGVSGTPPILTSLVLADTSPTRSIPLTLHWGIEVGSPHTQYCLLENESDVNTCIWRSGTLPASYLDSSADGPFELTAYLKNAYGVSDSVLSNSIMLDRTPPDLASAAIGNPNPTNNPIFSLSYGAITDLPYSSYCLLQNNTSVAACSWQSGSLPASFTVTSTDEPKAISIWLRDSAGNVSSRVTTAAVTYDGSPPALASMTITNSNPTIDRNYGLSFGTQTGTFSSYCILENSSAVAGCASAWVSSSTLPTSFLVSTTQNAKSLTIWLRDAAGNLSSSVTSTNTVILNSTFTDTIPFNAGTETQYSYDTSKIRFTGGVAELIPTTHTDSDNSLSVGFGAATVAVGSAWDSTNSHLRLKSAGGCDGSITNCNDLSTADLPTTGMSNYWGLNGSGSIANGAAVNATTGTNGMAHNPNGTGMSYVTGQLSQGIGFDGSDDYVTTTYPVSSFSGSFTLSGWMKSNGAAVGSDVPFIGGSNGTTSDYFYCGRGGASPSNAIAFGTGGNGNGPGVAYYGGASGRVNLKDTSILHHVVCVFDTSAGKKYVYYDGQAIALASGTDSTAAAWTRTGYGNLWIGANGGPISAKWDGTIDEAATWTRALSASEVLALYTVQRARRSGSIFSRIMDAGAWGSGLATWTNLLWKTTLPFGKNLPDYSGGIQNETSTDYSNLVGSTGTVGDNDLMSGVAHLWHLNETAGTTLKDSGAASGIDATLSGSYKMGEPGRIDRAVIFTGGYANLSSAVSLSGDFTLSGWARMGLGFAPDNTVAIFGHSGMTGSDTNFYASSYSLWTGSVAPVISTVVQNVRDIWHHYVVTRVGGSVKLYVDGSQNATGTWNGTFTFDSLGSNNDTHGSLGIALDEIAVWTRGLKAAEILQLYRRGMNGIRYQVRSCAAADCSGALWQGPDGTPYTFFTELNNNSVPSTGLGTVKSTGPDLIFSAFTSPPSANRYFQYRTFLDSDDNGTTCNYGSGTTACSPELQSVTIAPTHYDPSAPSIHYKTPSAFSTLTGFSFVAGSGDCTDASTPKFTYSIDETNWLYWNGSSWAPSNNTYAQANTQTTANMNIATLPAVTGMNSLYINVFMKSDGKTKCEIDSLTLSGTR